MILCRNCAYPIEPKEYSMTGWWHLPTFRDKNMYHCWINGVRQSTKAQPVGIEEPQGYEIEETL